MVSARSSLSSFFCYRGLVESEYRSVFLKLFPRYAGRARRGATVAGDNLRGTAVVVENAPKSLSRQCRTHGGHSATTRRILAAIVNGTPSSGAPAGSVSAGTHLVREWNGRTYQVEVIDNGYRFDGKTYPSLTAITKRITGTHWSGPRFFGLTPKRKA